MNRRLSVTERRKRFRGWLAGDRCVYGPNVWDPISARSAEQLGFEFGLLSAHVAEWTINGGEELCLVASVEYAEMARRIVRASDLSVMVTGPVGFGNALNFMRAVEELELAGVACVAISDQRLPMPFGRFRAESESNGSTPQLNVFSEIQQEVVDSVQQGRYIGGAFDFQERLPLDEAVALLKGAIAARRDPDLCIAARTNVMAVGDISQAIQTIQAYEAAGVDAIWLTHPHREGLAALHRACRIPLILGVSFFQRQSHTDPAVDRFLRDNGARIVSLGSAHFTAAVKAAHETLKALADGSKTYAELEQAQDTRQLMAELTQLDETNAAIERYLN